MRIAELRSLRLDCHLAGRSGKSELTYCKALFSPNALALGE